MLLTLLKKFSAPCLFHAKNSLPKRSFFWKNSKTDDQDKASSKTKSSKQEENEEDQWDNIAYIIQKMKTDNEQRPKLIPAKSTADSDKLTVVFEMDEVLAYVFAPDEYESYMSQPLKDYDYCVRYNDYDTYLSIYRRPYLDELLAYLRENTEPILYSQGVRSYVDLVLKYIDPNNTFKYVITQEEGCTRITNEKENLDDYIKDLNLLGRDLKRVIYIDSKPFNFWPNPDNGVPIKAYQADSTEDDDELRKVIELLEEMKNVSDIREEFTERFNVRQALTDTKML